MTDAGHSFAHLPHPTHLVSSMIALIPLKIVIAPKGHIFKQQPQATHRFSSTCAFRDILLTSLIPAPPYFFNIIPFLNDNFCDIITDVVQ